MARRHKVVTYRRALAGFSGGFLAGFILCAAVFLLLASSTIWDTELVRYIVKTFFSSVFYAIPLGGCAYAYAIHLERIKSREALRSQLLQRQLDVLGAIVTSANEVIRKFRSILADCKGDTSRIEDDALTAVAEELVALAEKVDECPWYIGGSGRDVIFQVSEDLEAILGGLSEGTLSADEAVALCNEASNALPTSSDVLEYLEYDDDSMMNLLS